MLGHVSRVRGQKTDAGQAFHPVDGFEQVGQVGMPVASGCFPVYAGQVVAVRIYILAQ